MLTLGRPDDALHCFGRIYTTFADYKNMPCNKTVDFSIVCSHLARLKYLKGDLADSLQFYSEAARHAEGDIECKEIAAAIMEIEKEIHMSQGQVFPVREENVQEVSHEDEE